MYLLSDMKRVLAILTLIAAVAIMPFSANASGGQEEELNPQEIIFHHLGDAYGWEVPFSHEHRIPLPIIVNDNAGNWHLFSSARLTDGGTYADGGAVFKIADAGDYSGKVVQVLADGSEFRPCDISITKDVCALLIASLLVAWMAFALVRFYKKNGMKAPRRGMGAAEMLVDFIYTGVLKDSLKEKAPKYAGYLLTVFFMIFFMNLLGLIVIFPGGANLTGNIAVTLVLAVCTFLITNIKGNKHYWKDIFWPDVPLWLKFPLPIMPLIEVFGMFTKPAALCIRLFANMMAGHSIALSLACIIFIMFGLNAFAGSSMTVVSVLMSVFMMLLEVLVCFIQALVFTMLSAVFISLAHVQEHSKE